MFFFCLLWIKGVRTILKLNDNNIILFGKGINIIEFDKKNNNIVHICQLNNTSKTFKFSGKKINDNTFAIITNNITIQINNIN